MLKFQIKPLIIYLINIFFIVSFQKNHMLLDPTGSDIVNCVSKGKSQVCISMSSYFSQLYNWKSNIIIFPFNDLQEFTLIVQKKCIMLFKVL